MYMCVTTSAHVCIGQVEQVSVRVSVLIQLTNQVRGLGSNDLPTRRKSDSESTVHMHMHTRELKLEHTCRPTR